MHAQYTYIPCKTCEGIGRTACCQGVCCLAGSDRLTGQNFCWDLHFFASHSPVSQLEHVRTLLGFAMLCFSLLLIMGNFGFRMTAGELLFATSSGMVMDLMDLMDSMDLDSGYLQLALFAQSVCPNIWTPMRFACTDEAILKQVMLDDDMFIIGVLDKEQSAQSWPPIFWASGTTVCVWDVLFVTLLISSPFWSCFGNNQPVIPSSHFLLLSADLDLAYCFIAFYRFHFAFSCQKRPKHCQDRGDCDLIRRLTAWLDAAVPCLKVEEIQNWNILKLITGSLGGNCMDVETWEVELATYIIYILLTIGYRHCES